ncbi:MAG: hypothetical protein ACRDYC_03115, partial [Acidimicrobiales bacterium]
PVTDPERLDFERGLGIPLIRTLVDHAQFFGGETGGTSVRLILFGGPAGDGDRTDEILRAVLSDELGPGLAARHCAESEAYHLTFQGQKL